MDYHLPEVSVTAPVSLAIERVKQILFRPFDITKWFLIGFCAWLANLGGNGFHTNYSYSGGKSPGTSSPPDLAHVRDYLQNNLSWIIPLALGLIVLFLAVWVVVLWLQSRGVFMLLHCVVLDRAEIAVPWSKFARGANSLWRFKLGLAAVALVLMLPLFGAMAWIGFDFINHGRHMDTADVFTVLGIVIVWMCLFVVFGIISYFTRAFAVPIMYLNGCTCVEAWRVLCQVLADNLGRFVLYLFFQIVIGIAIAFLVMAFVICTLLIGGLLLFIPYLGTVIMLPVIIFLRSYPLYYLAQYGPEFDVFRPAQPPPIPLA